jgi:hypothetical protein
MRITVLSAFAALTLMTVAARAESEGNGDPFPFRVTGAVTPTGQAAGTAAVAGPRFVSPAPRQQETAEAPSARVPHRLP